MYLLPAVATATANFIPVLQSTNCLKYTFYEIVIRVMHICITFKYIPSLSLKVGTIFCSSATSDKIVWCRPVRSEETDLNNELLPRRSTRHYRNYRYVDKFMLILRWIPENKICGAMWPSGTACDCLLVQLVTA